MAHSAGRLVLDLWESGEGRPSPERGLALLAAAFPGELREELAGLSVGTCDARLLELRAEALGDQVRGLAECPRCKATVEFCASMDDLRAKPPPESPQYEMTMQETKLRYRLPTRADLIAIAPDADLVGARRRLAERCIVEIRGRPGGSAPPPLSEMQITALAEQMAAHDPQAHVMLDLTCPACSERWEAPFDISSFFWTEIAAEARRLFREVHALAQGYGWTEQECLALSALRRRSYLELLAE